MAQSVTAGPPGREDHSLLRREVGRLDTVFFLISAMVVMDTIGAIAIAGAQAFTWLVVLFVLFFVPRRSSAPNWEQPSPRRAVRTSG